MRLVLTSAGVTTPRIRSALERLLGKPTAQARAVVVPTAIYPTPGGLAFGWQTLAQQAELGWESLGLLELTALPSLPEDSWLPELREADAIIVGGGNGGYLSYWLHRSGLAAHLPELLQSLVYVGISAGSAMVTSGLRVDPDRLATTGEYYDDEYDEAAPMGFGDDRTVPLVDLVVRPHLHAPYFPAATMDLMRTAAARVDVPLYALDDSSAVVVENGTVDVVSDGEWHRLDP